jgi:hypothetical protein
LKKRERDSHFAEFSGDKLPLRESCERCVVQDLVTGRALNFGSLHASVWPDINEDNARATEVLGLCFWRNDRKLNMRSDLLRITRNASMRCRENAGNTASKRY